MSKKLILVLTISILVINDNNKKVVNKKVLYI